VNYLVGRRGTGDVEAIYSGPERSRTILGWTVEHYLLGRMSSVWSWEKELCPMGVH